MTTVGVTDEVWARLSPSAACLTPLQRIKVALWSAVAAVIAAAVLTVTSSGLFIHRLSAGYQNLDLSTPSCSQSTSIANAGWFDEHIVGATLQPNGTSATLSRRLAGATIPSGGALPLHLHYTGPICHILEKVAIFQDSKRAAPDLVLRLRRPWGTSTATVRLASQPDHEGLSVRW